MTNSLPYFTITDYQGRRVGTEVDVKRDGGDGHSREDSKEELGGIHVWLIFFGG